uniref:Large ribosomal subunit protein uL3c n=1 Tax=Melanthalia intermedia TaxID=172989 RepID=A0A345UAU8_9FLOR|nr:ribosomal protein L3 [Melanthalia intermedia]AXI97584.1 ribosomal protein L3 [Melanthalia intermedia]
MTIGLLGKKIGMTQVFCQKGKAIPVTALQLGPCIITNIKKVELHGYQAIQIGYNEIERRKLSKAQVGHLEKSSIPPVKYLKEYKTNTIERFAIGQYITVNDLEIDDKINISSISIGKGFSGYQKRHNFSRGPMSHGSKNHRRPGSIGAGTTPGRVFMGKRMAGRMGGHKVTIKNLRIIEIDTEENVILVNGSVPGKPGSIISVCKK